MFNRILERWLPRLRRARLDSRATGLAALALVTTFVAAGPAAASSTVIWQKLLSSKAGSFSALAAAPSGGVFTTVGQYPFPLVQRYSAKGRVVWSHAITGTYWTESKGIVSDSTGAYVIAYDADGEARDGKEMLLRKYRNDGSVAWTARWGIVDSDEQVRSVAVHDGVVYAFYDGAQADADQITRFDAGTGHRMAGGDLDVPFNDADWPMLAVGIAVNDEGITLFMGGAENAGTSPALLLERLSLSGTPAWTRRLGTGSDEFIATSLSLDSQGIVLAYQPVGNEFNPRVARYSLAGKQAFDHALPGYASAGAAGDGTSVYALYETPIKQPDSSSIGVQRFSASGGKQGKATFGTHKGDVPYSILPVGSALFVGGASGDFSFYPLLAKIRQPAAN